MQANILEVLDVFGALGIEVTEGQLRIENGFSSAGSRQFWMNPGENLRAPKESAASEVLNIVSGPGIQVTADVLCTENGCFTCISFLCCALFPMSLNKT